MKLHITHKSLIMMMSLIMILQSCFPKDEPSITIINNSDDIIRDVYYWPSRLDTIRAQISIESGDKIQDKFNLEEVETDGSYLVSFRRGNNTDLEKVNFGYFTLGASLDRNFTLIVMSDTVLVNSK
ncbi:hypothetical protein [Roseivirga spongicola]|uniref:hypothetical protein n=1 Tax=Roseivirga spongicola TaxID=333140 RepID=UPI002AC8AF3A|nr:hypothetical protein [Roseivirga spongicola]WPZ11522.1 hypothetical protein T7867_05315 [Roseivirga spongicola]